jgi:hippurate hydrolase
MGTLASCANKATCAKTLAICCLAAGTLHLHAQDNSSLVEQQLPNLLATYKSLHAAPELSHHEEKTSALLAAELRSAGYAVTEHIGVYPDGSKAFGLVGILKNGPGPTLLVRADMDALPVTEKTRLAYASTVHATNPSGQDVGVMHACGHDIHVTTMIGVARVMAAEKAKWHGTLMLVGQPSEETIDGARAMLADHLYERFGTPDMAIALHDSNLALGTLAVTPGYAMASSTGMDVIMRGIGSHGSAPEAGKDPIVMSAEFIVALQTIVSRSTPPRSPAVLTVGDIHGGTKRNIIPNEVKLELTTRSFTDKSRQTIIDGLTQMAAGLTTSYGLPADKAAKVTVLDNESTPVLYNDPKLIAAAAATLSKVFPAGDVVEQKRVMGSEDVGVFGLDHKIPVAFFWLGAMEPAKFDSAVKSGVMLPGPHTSKFEPLPQPTLAVGVKALTTVAMSLLQ